MKKFLAGSFLMIVLSILIVSTQTSCKKETVTNNTTDTLYHNVIDTIYQCTPNITGLWVGTYTVGAGQPVPAGTQFYFSFSVYPDGTMSYKSKGFYNGSSDYIPFAYGTWQLSGNSFSFSVQTINIAGGGAPAYANRYC